MALLTTKASTHPWALRRAPKRAPRKSNSSKHATIPAVKAAETNSFDKEAAETLPLKALAPPAKASNATQAREAKPSINPIPKRRHCPAGFVKPTADQELARMLRKNGHKPARARPSIERCT